MKKLFALLLLLIIPASAIAEIDLSSMSYDELVALKDQINLAIWNSQEWQEVEVPQGVWLVGEDIPAGHWSIAPVADWASVYIGTVLDESKKDIDIDKSSLFHSVFIANPSYKRFKENVDIPSIDYELSNGTYVIVNSGDVCFTPYSGKPSLGFK